MHDLSHSVPPLLAFSHVNRVDGAMAFNDTSPLLTLLYFGYTVTGRFDIPLILFLLDECFFGFALISISHRICWAFLKATKGESCLFCCILNQHVKVQLIYALCS